MLQQIFSLYHKLPPPPGCSSSFLFKRRRTTTNIPLYASVKDPDSFEFDRQKAREALQQLDQQIETLSRNEPSPPKKRISFPNLEVDRRAVEMMKEEPLEFSESYLTLSAIALLVITLLYNIIFITIIQPSVDGPEPQPFSFFTTTNNTTIEEAPNSSVMQRATPPPISSQD